MGQGRSIRPASKPPRPADATSHHTFATRGIGLLVSGSMNSIHTTNRSQRRPSQAAAWFVVVSCLLATAQDANSAAVIRGPYLQQGTPTNLIVRWRTDAAHVGRVRYGESATTLSQFADDSASTANHAVLLTN